MKKTISAISCAFSLLATPALADQRMSGFAIVGGGYKITPQFSDLTYVRTDSPNYGNTWIYNLYDRDVISPRPGWSIFNAVNYNNARISGYIGEAYERPLVGSDGTMFKSGVNYKWNPPASTYAGVQTRLDYDCRHAFQTGVINCVLRPNVRYDWKL